MKSVLDINLSVVLDNLRQKFARKSTFWPILAEQRPTTVASILMSVNGNISIKYYRSKLKKLKVTTSAQYVLIPNSKDILIFYDTVNSQRVEMATFIKEENLAPLSKIQNYQLFKKLKKFTKIWLNQIEQESADKSIKVDGLSARKFEQEKTSTTVYRKVWNFWFIFNETISNSNKKVE